MSKFLEVAKKAALEAGKVSLKLRRKKLEVRQKDKVDSLLTEADLECNKAIIDILGNAFPDHKVISEESKNEKLGDGYTWVIDPIDGTVSYVAGLPTYGISVGLLKDREPYLGVIHLPVMNKLFWAERENGAFLNRKEISVDIADNIENLILGFDFEYKGERVKEFNRVTAKLIDEVRYPIAWGSVVSGMSNVAQGKYGAYLQWAYPWDFAAGAIIVTEAGGKVTDYQGKEIDWSKKDIRLVASNSKVHDQILSLINA